MRTRPDFPAAVLFDFDGTLCDTEIVWCRAALRVLRSYGADVSLEDMFALVGGDDRLTIPPLLERAGLAQTLDDYLRDLGDPERTYREEPLEAFDGAIEFVRSLKERDIRCGIVSTSPAASIAFALDRLGIVRLFDVLVTFEMVKNLKPSPEPYARALELLDVPAGECIVFEDSPTGIASAQAAGIYTVAFTGGSIAQDVSAADATISSWHDAWA